jgi:hypothetical protein
MLFEVNGSAAAILCAKSGWVVNTNLTLKECLNEKCTVAKIQGNRAHFS